MKTLILCTIGFCLLTFINAQPWKVPIYRLSGSTSAKTIKIKPDRRVTIHSLVNDADSLKLSETYNGSVIGVSTDSMRISLTDYTEFRKYASGMNMQTRIPGKIYFKDPASDTGKVSIPISDIHLLIYRPVRNEKLPGIAEGAVFTCLAGVLLSPFICYNYKEGHINADTYKYWGVASSVGLTASFCFEMISLRTKEYQFKTDWPQKKKKVWSFAKRK
jgi:hypothetical protein